jgi:hypothetical protein
MLKWLRINLNDVLATITAVAIVTIAALSSRWWGGPAMAFIGSAVVMIVLLLLMRVDITRKREPGIPPGIPTGIPPVPKATSLSDQEVKTPVNFDRKKLIPWVLIFVPLVIAVFVRFVSGYPFVWPIVIRTPAIPQPQSILLILATILLLLLVCALARALKRGEGVAIESHWGGLGGGIGGFQLSTPLICLLGIIFLLAVVSATAWRVYPPPAKENTEQPPGSETSGTTTSPSPSPTPPQS